MAPEAARLYVASIYRMSALMNAYRTAMASSRTPYVHSGKYWDYHRQEGFRAQWLWPNFWANFWTNFLGILVTIALSRLVRISFRVRELISGTSKNPDPLESLAWDELLHGIQELFTGSIRLPHAAPVAVGHKREALRHISWGLCLLLTFAGFLACGAVTALLATDSSALSEHPDCGLYLPKIQRGSVSLNITRPYETAAQTESANLANLCFDGDDYTDGCNFFIQKAIPITIENTTCPFPEHLCYGQGIEPVRFTTGSVSGRILGIHAPRTFDFNRTTVCSPLNMNRTYVNLMKHDDNKYTFGYYYGPSTEIGEASFQTVRRNDRGDVPTYEVDSLWSDGTLTPELEWFPIPELRPPPGASVSLMIVTSQKINYVQQSFDPIFPATDAYKLPGDPTTYYINLSGPGTVLACVDWNQWRDPTHGPGWLPSVREPLPLPSNLHVRGGMEFLQTALLGSTFYNAISLRSSAALVAQSRLSGFVSLPLAAEQWKVEAEAIFKASLARIMINARNIARGAPHKFWGYEKLEMKSWFCDQVFIFNSVGWTNVNLVGSVCILTFSFTIIFLAVPVGSAANGDDKLLFEVIPELAVAVYSGVIGGVKKVLGWKGWPIFWDFLKHVCQFCF